MSEQRRLGYRWNLRRIMGAHGLWKTTDLAPLLKSRGISLSETQIYRLVSGTPERVSIPVLIAICDALDCTPTDLIEQTVELRAAATANAPVQIPDEWRGSNAGPAHRIHLVDEDD